MPEIHLKIRYFERGLSKSFEKGNSVFLTQTISHRQKNADAKVV